MRRDFPEIERPGYEKRLERAGDVGEIVADRNTRATKSVRALDDDRIPVRAGERGGGLRVVDDRVRWHGDAERVRGPRQARLVDTGLVMRRIAERVLDQRREAQRKRGLHLARRKASQF